MVFKKFAFIGIFLTFLIGLSACLPTTGIQTGYAETAVMGTVHAVLTQSGIDTLVAQLTAISISATPQSSPVSTLTNTLMPSDGTATPSSTITATETTTQTPLQTASPTPSVTSVQGSPAATLTNTKTPTRTPIPPTPTSTQIVQVVKTTTPTRTLLVFPSATASKTAQATATKTLFLMPSATSTPQGSQPSPTTTAQVIQPTLTFTNTAIQPAPTATQAVSGVCNWASFVSDISVPDGTRFTANARFTKTWRLKNIGTCTWTTAYSLIFDSGDSLSGPASVSMPRDVAPGETVDISVNLIAPGYPVVYMSYWKLQSGSGEKFGIGAKANGVIWVKIEVVQNNHDSFSFFDQVCNASWTSSKGPISCSGKYNITTGSVTYITEPIWEGGDARRDQPTLVTIPPDGSDGYISGTFPAYQIKAGDHLHTHLGCLDEHPNCEVWFTISYLDANGVSHTLYGPDYQTDDGYVSDLDIDLNPYQNTTVQFVLTVQNNGSSSDDYAFWFYPIIWNN